MRKKNNSLSSTQRKKKSYFKTMFVLEKDRIFITSKESLITEDSGRAEVEKDNTIETLKCENEAHIVVLCTSSQFFCKMWALLMRQKKASLKIQLTIKGKQNFKYNKLPHVKCEKLKIIQQVLQ